MRTARLSAKQRSEHKAAGLCVLCPEPQDGETLYCRRHRRDMLEYQLAFRERSGVPVGQRRCSRCKGYGHYKTTCHVRSAPTLKPEETP